MITDHALLDRKPHTVVDQEAEAARLDRLEGAALVASENLVKYLPQLPQERREKVLRQLHYWLTQAGH